MISAARTLNWSWAGTRSLRTRSPNDQLVNRNKLLLVGNLIVGIAASTAVFVVQGAQPGHPFPLQDFPPSPLEAKFSPNGDPKSDPLVHDVEHFLIRHATSTNPAALALMAEIKEMKSQLLTQQETANAKDPLLQVFG